jgi:putative sigma-54 modulation protein
MLLARKRRQIMQIIIKGKQMEVTSQLRQRIERKVQRLSRFVNDTTRVEITVVEERTRSAKDRYSVHLALSGNSSPIYSEVSALNASTALDLVIDKVVAQLGRQKDRYTARKRHHTPPVKVLTLSRSGTLLPLEEEQAEAELEMASSVEISDIVEEQENEQIWSRIMEIRHLPTKPMSDQEVIEEMEKSGASFYPFFNEETGSINVMYRLPEEGYGLLVPIVE